MKENNSIQCTVSKCAHHSQNIQYCTLKQIDVNNDGTTSAQCSSFELK